MKLHLFANRVHRTYFSGGSVVIEFCVIPPDDNGEVSAETPVTDADVHFAVTMPLNGYLRSVGQMRKYNEELQQKGYIKKPEGKEGAGGEGGGGGQGQGGQRRGGPGGQGGQGGPGGGGQRRGGPGGGGGQGGQAAMRGGQDPQARNAEKRRRMEKQASLEDLTDQNGEEPLV